MAYDAVDGASLFYTTQQPSTLQVLRQYALHLLFIPPAPSPGLSTGTDAPAPVRNPFPFTQKPNTLDRDRIVVPAGWDSWGKIAVLREGFDAKGWGEAWERDLESVNEDENAVGDDEVGARKMYSQLVPDQGYKVWVSFNRRLPFNRLIRFLLAASPPTLQQPNPRTNIPRQKLRRKLQETRPRSTWHVPQPHRIHRRRKRRDRRSSQLFVLLHAQRRTRSH